jgi:hypothetical protein
MPSLPRLFLLLLSTTVALARLDGHASPGCHEATIAWLRVEARSEDPEIRRSAQHLLRAHGYEVLDTVPPPVPSINRQSRRAKETSDGAAALLQSDREKRGGRLLVAQVAGWGGRRHRPSHNTAAPDGVGGLHTAHRARGGAAAAERQRRPRAGGAGADNEDAEALLAAFEVAESDRGAWAAALTGWSDGADDPCGWEGIGCNATTGRVDTVDFSAVEARGQLRFTLGPAVGRLDALRIMDLAHTQLHGSLLEEVTTLRRLKYLNVRSTSLSGTLPSTVGDLSALQQLDVRSTSLSGTLPSTVGNLSALQVLDVRYTSLSARRRAKV